MEKNVQSENYLKNALVLAFLGDSVFTLMVRNFLVQKYDYKPNELNKKANQVVCARFQAEIMQNIKLELDEYEQDLAKRARNTHLSNNKAKNSTIEEYSLATQFEALIGYWHLNKDESRLNYIFGKYVMEKL